MTSANKNTVSVAIERSYNVGNFEQVRIKVEYGASVPEGLDREKAAAKLAKTLPETIESLFTRFAKAHELKRSVPKKD